MGTHEVSNWYNLGRLLIFFSKINQEFLKKTLAELLATKKERKFVEAVELQIGLRDYDPEKDKRFTG